MHINFAALSLLWTLIPGSKEKQIKKKTTTTFCFGHVYPIHPQSNWKFKQFTLRPQNPSQNVMPPHLMNILLTQKNWHHIHERILENNDTCNKYFFFLEGFGWVWWTNTANEEVLCVSRCLELVLFILRK